MLYVVWLYKGRERYLINAQKSVEVLLSLFKKFLDMEQVTLDDIPIRQESDTVHLGVDKNLKGNGNAEKKAHIGRRTMYALMGAGAYGNSGLNPLVPSKIWKTFALPRMLYGKRTCWLKYKYLKSDVNFRKYKTARNIVTNKLRSARYDFEKNLASKIKTDNKLFWNYVRTKTKTKSVVSKLEMPNGELSSNDQETANTLNEYFSTVFEIEPDDPLPNFEDRPFHYITDNLIINENNVEKAVAALKPGKSQGPDLIHPKFLKETKDYIIQPLTTIFQKSLDESLTPPIWKRANVSAIFKKGEKKKPPNYLPISLTSIPCKLMEKLVRDAIVNHMTENNLFSNAQHGFIKGKSCVTQLLEFMEEITQAIDNNDEVDIIYLDFCKAFDKVLHRRLLQKLYAYGIRGKVHSWVQEFLTDRKQRVIVNGSQSTWKNVTSGIPQGSVLGPVLFLVFINDFPDIINVLIKLFADDAKLYSIVTSENDNRVQFSLNTAVDWANVWRMIFNIIKCYTLGRILLGLDIRWYQKMRKLN